MSVLARPESLCVVHLVRVGEPVASLRRFLASYAEHPAGAPHELVILYKGFESEAALAPHRAAAAGVPHGELRVGDEGFDLTAYRAAAEMLGSRHYCFLNSHSRVLVDGWLGLLQRALDHPGAGLAGATGSWASQNSFARYLLHLPSAYSGLYRDRQAAMAAFVELDRSRERGDARAVLEQLDSADGGEPLAAPAGEAPPPRGLARPARMLRDVPQALRVMRAFAPFPAPHLRTNAFLVEHELWVDLPRAPLHNKFEAYALESGRRGLTRQIQDRGLSVVVADRFGSVHDPLGWPASETLWQGAQGGLIVADNQTDIYAFADMRRRTLLARFAWGEQAAPAEPDERP